MSGIISSAAKLAHQTAVAALSVNPIQPGASLPEISVKTKPDTADVNIHSAPGKVIILGVPGAFTPPCSSQIPSYIQDYEKFVAKGISAIYVVAVNDAFVVNAWKEKLAPQGTPIHFVADDQGQFVSALGLVFDATPLLGGPRSKRFAIVAENGKVLKVNVEEDAPDVKLTAADNVLGQL
ncbi:hypothetical protein FRB99_002828 [Tulasnella sp. 403]|nr:hypothetical protein FRB99_002828 [Tulasnella sp. 403]